MTTRTHRRAANIALAVVATLMVYAAWRATRGITLGVPDVPAWAWAFLAGLLIRTRLAFKCGQLWRGYQHARGIRKSHFTAVRGGRH